MPKSLKSGISITFVTLLQLTKGRKHDNYEEKQLKPSSAVLALINSSTATAFGLFITIIAHSPSAMTLFVNSPKYFIKLPRIWSIVFLNK